MTDVTTTIVINRAAPPTTMPIIAASANASEGFGVGGRLSVLTYTIWMLPIVTVLFEVEFTST